METLIIDLKILKKKYPLVLNYFKSQKSLPKILGTDRIGFLIVINLNYYNKILETQEKKKILELIRSPNFISSIKYFQEFIYRSTPALIEIRFSQLAPKYMLKKILEPLSNLNIPIWIGQISKTYRNQLLKMGFYNFYLTEKSPLGYKFPTLGMGCFYIPDSSPTESGPLKQVNLELQKKIIKYNQKNHSKYCNIYGKFTPETVKYLYGLIYKKSSISNREISGALGIEKIESDKEDKMIIHFSRNKTKNINMGGEQQVVAVWSRYNFHTHPKKAYITNMVHNGWPSGQDFWGFIKLSGYTIFHTVVTLEGLYIISLNPNWLDFIKNIDKTEIFKNYDINHKRNITPQEWCKIINNIKYNSSSRAEFTIRDPSRAEFTIRDPSRGPLFRTKYFTWDKASRVIFKISYLKNGENCLLTDELLDVFNKYY